MNKAELRESLRRWSVVAKKRHARLSRTRALWHRARSVVLRRRKQLRGLSSPKAAYIRWALSKVGVHEVGYSNTGPEIDRWEREFGMRGQPYCAMGLGYGIRKVGRVDVAGDIPYTPNILRHARAGTGGFQRGLKPWAKAQPGDWVLFKFPGVSRDPVDHVGLYIGDGRTVEFNTSPGTGGSQNNGGGVYIRRRPAAVVVGCARPRYPQHP